MFKPIRYILERRVISTTRRRILAYAGLQVPVKPALIDKPSGSRIIVLAPHPDDEIIGAGELYINIP